MKKRFLLPAAFLFTSSVLSYGLVAKADDDHKEKDYYNYNNEQKYEQLDYEKYRDEEDDDDNYDYYEKGEGEYERHHEKYEDDDEDEYEQNQDYYYYDQQQPQVNVVNESWYKWSRSAAEPTETTALPISQAAEISLKLNNEEPITVGAIPNVSQLLVPVEEVAKYLGAKTVVYPNSEIIEINKGNMQLIVRNNTKVVYENMRKTPMQAQIVKKNDVYYMPISVLANGLGFQINEKTTNNQILLEGVAQL